MEKISDIFRNSSEPVFSFEFFPPKNEEGEEKLFNTIESLKELNPGFVSVTYGAGGSTREKTRHWVRTIQDDHNLIAMAHYTCVGHGKEEIRSMLQDLYDDGIRNIMALRGDPPKGETAFTPPPDGFAHANELITYIKSTGLDFSLGGAAYPEVHQEAISAEDDLNNAVRKVEDGAEFLVTQLFFDNQAFFNFRDRLEKAGVTVPLVAGIMPITNYSQIAKFISMAGCKIPEKITKALEACGDNKEKLLEVSMKQSVDQCRELLENGVPGIHFYTLNQSKATMNILRALKS